MLRFSEDAGQGQYVVKINDTRLDTPLIKTESVSEDLDALILGSVRIMMLYDTSDGADRVPIHTLSTSASNFRNHFKQ